jgi:peptidylprolyl isomerase
MKGPTMRRLAALALIPLIAAAPAAKPRTPTDVIAASKPAEWAEIPAEDLLVIDLASGKRVVVQLAPAFAPVHVANIQKLALGGYWQGAAIYRVQDNYVAQWGNNDSNKSLPAGVVKTPPAEYHRTLKGLKIVPLGSPDPYAPAVGFTRGWPVAYDPKGGTANLTHCYGSVGVGRDLSPDTGMGGELYAAIGHAPRHLDRNIAVVGRVIAGMEHLSSLPRGTEALGFYKERGSDVPIASVHLASELVPAARPRYQYLKETSAAFAQWLHLRKNRRDDFYIRPAGGVDLCNAPVPVRAVPAG